MAKKVSVYALLTVICLGISYIEGICFSFISVPGLKLGLANCIPMLLIKEKKYGASILINLTRILLSCLLFGNFYSLVFSLAGAFFSTLTVLLLSFMKFFTFAGISCAAGTTHNIGQIIAAIITLGTKGVIYLLPFLMLCGCIMGLTSGILLNIFKTKYKKTAQKIIKA